MDITAAAAGASHQPQSQAQASGASLAKDFQTFLKLLTTQLQYQDPLEPLDSKEFTQQLVSFTGVEQQIAANQNLETLIAQLAAQSSSNAVAYIGKDVIVNTSASKLTADGAKWTYALDVMADENTLVIKNASGTVVHEIPGKLDAGNHEFMWDGRNKFGQALPEGLYSLEVQAKTANGTAITSSIYSRGRVQGLERVDGENYLLVNDLLFPPDYITSIMMPESQMAAAD